MAGQCSTWNIDDARTVLRGLPYLNNRNDSPAVAEGKSEGEFLRDSKITPYFSRVNRFNPIQDSSTALMKELLHRGINFTEFHGSDNDKVGKCLTRCLHVLLNRPIKCGSILEVEKTYERFQE